MPTWKLGNLKCYGLDLETVATLDLSTRSPVPGSQPFTRLFPYEDTRDIIETNKSYVKYSANGKKHPNTLHWDDCLNDWWHASMISAEEYPNGHPGLAFASDCSGRRRSSPTS